MFKVRYSRRRLLPLPLLFHLQPKISLLCARLAAAMYSIPSHSFCYLVASAAQKPETTKKYKKCRETTSLHKDWCALYSRLPFLTSAPLCTNFTFIANKTCYLDHFVCVDMTLSSSHLPHLSFDTDRLDLAGATNRSKVFLSHLR